MDIREAYQRALAGFGQRVATVRADQWHNPTPCADWDVRALVNHLVYENRWVPELLAGRTVAQVGDAYEGDLLGEDPVEAADPQARLLAAWGRAGEDVRTLDPERRGRRGRVERGSPDPSTQDCRP